MHGPHLLQPHPHPLQPAGEPLASQMAFPHHGIPPRSPRAGKWILSSAHCSWNCRHSVSWSAALPSPGLPRVAGSSRDIRVPTSSPTPIGVHTPQRHREGKRTELGAEQPSPPPSLPLVGYCSQMETVRPRQPQIHTGRYIRIPGMCDCPASPSVALDSITCQVPSASPGAETPSPTPSLCVWNTDLLWLSKYLSWAKGRPMQLD